MFSSSPFMSPNSGRAALCHANSGQSFSTPGGTFAYTDETFSSLIFAKAPQIGTGKLVSSFAVELLCLVGSSITSALGEHVVKILCDCPKKEMGWIYARRVI